MSGGWLMRLLPRDLRRAYGAEVRTALHARIGEERRSRGWLPAIAYAMRALVDLVATAARTRMASGRLDPGAARRRGLPAGIGRDLRFSARLLARDRAFAAAAILTLGFGIGITSAIVGLVDAALLRPASPFEDPQSLVAVYSFRDDQQRYGSLSYPDFVDLREADVFDGLTAIDRTAMNLDLGNGAIRISGELVSPNYFELLGAELSIGRGLSSCDVDLRCAVISYGLWRGRFAGSEAVLGTTVRLNGHSYTVVGVAARAFRGTRIDAAPDIWVPVERIGDFVGFIGRPLDGSGSEILAYRGYMTFDLVGRLAPGRTIDDAQLRVAGVAAAIRQRFSGYPIDFAITPLQWGSFRLTDRAEVVRYAAVLIAVAGVVLLIGCTNVANLLLARAVDRRREIAIRRALGAERARLFAQLFTESALLAVIGGGIGLLMAVAALPIVSRLRLPAGITVAPELDTRLALLAGALSVVSVLLIGILPAMRASASSLTAFSRRRRQSSKWREAMVAGQLALGVVLVLAAGLLTRTSLNLAAVDVGFETRNVLVASLDPSLAGHDERTGLALFGELLDTLNRLPGVHGAAIASEAPLAGARGGGPLFVDATGTEPQTSVGQSIVSPEYFRVLGIGLATGRRFNTDDGPGSRPVVVVNQAFAERFWPGERALGRTVRATPEGAAATVVGVVADSRHGSLREPPGPHLYWPQLQVYSWLKGSQVRTLLVGAGPDPAVAMATVRTAVGFIDPHIPLFDVATLEDRILETTVIERQSAALLVGFGAAGFLLAGIGLFGSLSYMLSRRRRELGVRSALGASPGHLFGAVVRQGLGVALVGGAVGWALAVPASRLIAGWLFGVETSDPLTLAFMAAALATVALVATVPVAIRAASTDPIRAMRVD